MTHRPAELIRRTTQALAALYMREAAEDAPTIAQISVLECLHWHGPLTCQEIAVLTGFDKTTTFAMMDRLVANRHVDAGGVVENRKPGPRPIAFVISRAGRKALRLGDEALIKAEWALLDSLPIGDRAPFVDALRVTAFVRPGP